MGRRGKTREKQLYDQIDALLDAGETHRDISLRLGCSTNTVRKARQRRKSRAQKGASADISPAEAAS